MTLYLQHIYGKSISNLISLIGSAYFNLLPWNGRCDTRNAGFDDVILPHMDLRADVCFNNVQTNVVTNFSGRWFCPRAFTAPFLMAPIWLGSNLPFSPSEASVLTEWRRFASCESLRAVSNLGKFLSSQLLSRSEFHTLH